MAWMKDLVELESLKSLNLYKFVINDKWLAYDVNSSHVLGINQTACEILDAIEKWNSNETIDPIFNKFNENDIEEFLSKIINLKEKGVLSSSDYLREKIIDKTPTSFIRLLVSDNCDLKCKYCYANVENKSRKPVSMVKITAEKSIDYLIKRSGEEKNLSLEFYGGEPTLNFPVIKNAVEYAKNQAQIHDKEINFYIFTNCYSLTDEIIDFFKVNNFNVAISLDGPEKIHNEQRPTQTNEESYQKVKKNALKLLQNIGQENIFVRGTFTNRCYNIEEIVMDIVQLGFRNISVQPCILPENHEYAITLNDLPKIEKEYNHFAQAYLNSLLNGNYFYFYPFFSVIEKLYSHTPSLTPCNAGRSLLAVSTEGDIYPCHELVGSEKLKIGEVNNLVTDEHRERALKSIHIKDKEQCRDCWARYLCGGTCLAHSIKYTDNILTPYEIKCKLTKHRLRLGIWLYSELISKYPNVLKNLLNRNITSYPNSTGNIT